MKLDKYEIEDLEDLLFEVEHSFDIKFEEGELLYINTLGDFYDHVKSKVNLAQVDDCTSQQAFYKLRDIIQSEFGFDRNQIKPSTLLEEILPRAFRRERVDQIETNLGFKLKILIPPLWVSKSLIVLLFCSMIGFILAWQFGLLFLVISVLGFWLADRHGNELELKTIGEIAEKMKRQNYTKSRRDNRTFNSDEIELILNKWVIENLDRTDLNRETTFS